MGAFAKASASRKVASLLGGLAMLGTSALVLSGCAAGAGGGGGPVGDLTLKIGTALPQSGSLAFLGPPEEAGVALAVKDVNDAAKGITIEVTYGDSGDTDNKAYETEVPRLLDAGVTAILGAASSGTSLQFIDQVVGAGVIQFSPANTSAALSTYDDKGLYFRTAPSDVLQGEVLGNLIAADGHSTLGMIVLNDSYGNGDGAKDANGNFTSGLAGFVTAAFTAAGGTVVSQPTFNTGDTNFDAQISEVTASNPDAIVLITFEELKTIAPKLLGGGFPAENVYLVDGNVANYSEDFKAGLLEGSKGTVPGLNLETIADFTTAMNDNWVAAGNADLADVFAYGPEAYDAVVLLALAAMEAGSVEGVDMAAKLQEVSGGTGDGTKCTTFVECADIIIGGGTADYDGVSGPITLNEVGDPTEASIQLYQYGADNVAVPFAG
jgi:branched-chain amino acid transport system substrate-binding protein